MTQFANVAFVGCGSHSTNNLYPMLKYSRCKLVAVCDKQEQLARRNAEIYGGKAYADVDKMLASEKLDGVLIVGPAEMHYELGKKVLERGVPLFIEKPPAPDLAKTLELVALAKAKKTFVMTAFMKRHGLCYAKIREFMKFGRFVPASGFFRYTHWSGTHMRGTLMGMSIHPIDLAISFFGDPAEVTSHWSVDGNFGSLALTIRFTSGKFAQLMLGSSVRIQEHVEITGSFDGKDAAFVVDDVQHMELHTAGRNGIDLVACKDGKWLTPEMYEIDPQFDLDDIKVWRPDYAIPNMAQNSPFLVGYAGEIREFANAILEKREPYPGTDDTPKAMRVIEAVTATPNGVSVIA